MYDRMLRLAEGRDNKTFSLGAYGDDNTIFHYYLECGWYLSDDFYGYPEDGKFLIFIWSYYPLREAMQELTPTYAATGMLMLLMSAILAFALLRVWRKQERVEQARRDTTAALAHELKTPLSVLSATAELLSDDMAQDKRAHYLDVIRQQAARMDGSVRACSSCPGWRRAQRRCAARGSRSPTSRRSGWTRPSRRTPTCTPRSR